MYGGIIQTDEKDRELIKLKAKVLSLEQQNKLIHEKYKDLKAKDEILRELRYLMKTPSDSSSMRLYEEGQIKALLYVLGYSDETTYEELQLKESGD